MWSLFSLIVSRRSRSVIWLVPLFAVLVQLHLSAIALGGVAVAAIAVYRPAVRLATWRWESAPVSFCSPPISSSRRRTGSRTRGRCFASSPRTRAPPAPATLPSRGLECPGAVPGRCGRRLLPVSRIRGVPGRVLGDLSRRGRVGSRGHCAVRVSAGPIAEADSAARPAKDGGTLAPVARNPALRVREQEDTDLSLVPRRAVPEPVHPRRAGARVSPRARRLASMDTARHPGPLKPPL